MCSIAYESAWRRLKNCARIAHELEARQDCLRQEAEALQARTEKVRDAQRATREMLRARERERRRMEAFIATLEGEQTRELLRLRYVDGLTLPQMLRTLEERGVFYTQRYIERLLREAERRAEAAWPDYARREDVHARHSR